MKNESRVTLWAAIWCCFSFTVWLCASAAPPGMVWGLPKEQEMTSGCRSGTWGVVKSCFGGAETQGCSQGILPFLWGATQKIHSHLSTLTIEVLWWKSNLGSFCPLSPVPCSFQAIQCCDAAAFSIELLLLWALPPFLLQHGMAVCKNPLCWGIQRHSVQTGEGLQSTWRDTNLTWAFLFSWGRFDLHTSGMHLLSICHPYRKAFKYFYCCLFLWF